MAKPTPEAILEEDQLLVANFDRAFAELPGTGRIQRLWTWSRFGIEPRTAFATFLTFTIDHAEEMVTVQSGPVDEETRLYVTASDVVQYELGEFYGPKPRLLADRCAAAVAEWLSTRGQRQTPTSDAFEASLEKRGLPFARWPEPLPSITQPTLESAQLRLLRR